MQEEQEYLKDRRKALRRHRTKSIHHKRRKVRLDQRWQFTNPDSFERWVRRSRETPQLCSCLGCGNQRKYEGMTLQEKRQIIMLKEEM